LHIAEELGDKNQIATWLSNIGAVYKLTGKIKQSEECFKNALSISKEIGDKEVLKETCYNLSLLYDTIGRYENALEYYKLYIVYRDSISNEENIQKQTRIEMNYEFDKKQTADSIKNAELANQETFKHEQEIKQQKTYTYGGVLGFILMLVVSGVSFRAFKQKQKANEIIAMQKEFVEEKQREILDSIYYAKRIQQSLLPTEKYIEKKLKELRKLSNK